VTEPEREVLADLVHEVRSPVAALAAVAEALREIDTLDDRRELVQLAIGACEAIERIVGDAAVASVRLEAVDVERLVRDFASASALAEAPVSVHVEEGLPVIEGDPVRLRQALDNLVSNALLHGGGRGVIVRAARTADGVSLAVADEGPGIAPEHIGRIFDRGIRLDETRPGSGLGLSVTRAIVQAHDGTIAVDSVSGEGTRVTITLRASQSDT
jgi:signal transduction histidine kinase